MQEGEAMYNIMRITWKSAWGHRTGARWGFDMTWDSMVWHSWRGRIHFRRASDTALAGYDIWHRRHLDAWVFNALLFFFFQITTTKYMFPVHIYNNQTSTSFIRPPACDMPLFEIPYLERMGNNSSVKFHCTLYCLFRKYTIHFPITTL